MNKKITPQEIAGLLNRSANQLNDNTLDGLRQARQLALQRQAVSTPAWVDRQGLLHAHATHHHRTSGWFLAAIVAALLLGNLAYWCNTSEQGRGDIDIAILTDEMPIEVYVD